MFMNQEQPPVEQPIEAPIADVPHDVAHPRDSQSPDPRRRMRELLAIHDRDRTDAQWDELIALEIELAPGNRAQAPQADVGVSARDSRRYNNFRGADRDIDSNRRRRRVSAAPQPGHCCVTATVSFSNCSRSRTLTYSARGRKVLPMLW